MSKMSTNAKAQRVLKFLIGTRNPQVRQCLQPHGFGDDQDQKGWVLLRQASEARGAYQPHVSKDPTIVMACDDWRVRWFAVAKSALQHNYPEVSAWLFSGLQSSQGELSTVTVPMFVKRVRQLATGDAQVANAKEARDLLATRGLTDAVLAVVDPWVEQLTKAAGTPPPPVTTTVEQAAAETALWDWYLEWSGIARAAIQDRVLLRTLGFLRSRRAAPTKTNNQDPTKPHASKPKAPNNINTPVAA